MLEPSMCFRLRDQSNPSGVLEDLIFDVVFKVIRATHEAELLGRAGSCY